MLKPLVKNINSGFTLLELLISVSILAILMSLATPSFVNISRQNKLTSQAIAVQSLFTFSRAEAIRLRSSDYEVQVKIESKSDGGWVGVSCVKDTVNDTTDCYDDSSKLRKKFDFSNKNPVVMTFDGSSNPLTVKYDPSGFPKNLINDVTIVIQHNNCTQEQRREIKLKNTGRTTSSTRKTCDT